MMDSSEERTMSRSLPAARLPGWQAFFAGALLAASASAAVPIRSDAAARAAPAADRSALSQRHRDTLAVAAKERSAESLCAAIASADQAQQSLGLELQRRRDQVFALSPVDSAALDRLDRSAAESVAQLPGVGLAVGAETVYHYVRYGALASYAPKDSAAERALRLAADIWSDPAGRAVYFEQSTDISGCLRPAAMLPALRSLAAAWPSVPACLQAHLRPRLTEAVDEVANGTCYCANEAETAAALAEVATLGKSFADASVRQGSDATPTPAAGPPTYTCR
jgi:hypothetical protein